MADPRFYDNRGPFSLAELCKATGLALPAGANAHARIGDLASLTGAGPDHLTFFTGGLSLAGDLAQTAAGYCLVPQKTSKPLVHPPGLVAIVCQSVTHAFAAAAGLYYPQASLPTWSQSTAIDPTAKISAGAHLAPGVVIGPGAEVGEGTRLGPNTVVGRGVAIGRNCEIGSNCTLANAYIGDEVVILPGAQIGQPGFGFASGPMGHIKIPQIGRVIVQDRVEIGACTTIDRGALGDTVIGEGTKLDNLVQIGHNVRLGRNDIVVSQVGISGSCELGDFVVLGGQVGIADHARIGSGVRIAARSAMSSGQELMTPGDYGGMPAKPVREWIREIYTLTNLSKRHKRSNDGK